MKKRLPFLLLGLVCLAPLALRADGEETLWKIDFKDLGEGKTPVETTYGALPNTGPQRVMTDKDNTLLGGGKPFGSIETPLLYHKGGPANYTPALWLTAAAPLLSGTVTVSFDLGFDSLAMAANPVETLMAFPFLNDKGGTDFLLVVANGGDGLLLSIAGLGKQGSATFRLGEVAHVKGVLDLTNHTFQAFVNDKPLGEPVKDEAKFSGFKGFIVRDGSALGGNKGATFTAAVGNIVVTHQP
ncbi:MAG TPA: hypothetical protein VIM58_13175 [Candidatus Methylacidiphilales bacterium]